MSDAPTLLIPSETRVREFDGKLLLACLAAERGHDCIVGSRVAMHERIDDLPVGVYVAKDMFRSSARMLSILRRLGHDVVGWDEESLVFVSRELYLRHRVSPRTTRWIRRVFAWGDEDRATKASSEAFRAIPIDVVGNPRMDLLRPELRGYYGAEAEALRQQHGRFLLINSNFGRLNHLLPAQRLDASEANRAAYEAAEPNGLPFDYWLFRAEIFRAMKQSVPALADAFPELSIVVRPHPSEDGAAWVEAAGGRANVTVTNAGSAVPWLMAAEAVIHNGCTTGLEAYLLDRPVIAYQPLTHPTWDLELPNSVSDSARGLPDLLARTGAAVAGEPAPGAAEPKRAILRRYLAGLEGPLASELILDRIARHAAMHPAPPPSAVDRRTARLDAWRRRMLKRVSSVIPGHKNSPRYNRQRFADMPLAEVTARIDALGRVLGRFDAVRAEQLHDNVFRIARA